MKRQYPQVVMNLVEAAKATILGNKREMGELLKKEKIHLSIVLSHLPGGLPRPEILVKLLPIISPKPRKSPTISSETAEKITMAKQMFKQNSDALYLFTLLARVEEYTKKLKLKNLTPQGVKVVEAEFDAVMGAMSRINKQLVKM